MNYFSFFLSGKLFICPSVLNDSFAGQNNHARSLLLFMTLNISCKCLLACKVSFEKSADSLMGTPLQVTNCFSLAAFKILSLFLNFGILITMCLAVHILCMHLVWDSWCFLELQVYFLHQTKSFISLFFQIFSISCSFFSPAGTPMM